MADKKRYNERADRGDVNKKQKADECRGSGAGDITDKGKGKIAKCRGSGAGGIADKEKGKIGKCRGSGAGGIADKEKGKIGKCRGSGAGGIADKGKGKIAECSRSGVGDYSFHWPSDGSDHDDEWEKNYQEDYGPDHDDPNSKEVDYGDSPPEDENEDEDEFPRSPYNGVGVNVRGREVLSDNSDDDTGGAGAGEVDVQEQGNISGLVDEFSKLDPFQGFADGSKNKDDEFSTRHSEDFAEYKKDNKEEEATQLLRTIDDSADGDKDSKEEEAEQLVPIDEVAGTSVQTELILNLPDLGEWCMKI